MPNIESLTSKIEEMGSSLHTWNSAVTTIMAFTAFLGVLYFITTIITRHKAEQLSKAKDELIQEMDQGSKKEIAIAKGQSDQANAKASKADEMAAQANERAKHMELRLEEVKGENLKLQIKLEEERNARLEIERRLAPRFLTSKEETAIFDNLRPFAGHRIEITKLGDAEAGPYGEQIANAFRKAKWIVTVNFSGTISPPLYGILCLVSPNPDIAVKTLIATFQKITTITVNPSPNLPGDHISIIIGLKPPQ